MRYIFSIVILTILSTSCGSEESDMFSNDICIACSQNPTHDLGDAVVFIPTVITPNGDGYNDQFRIFYLDDFPNNSLIIYDRNKNEIARFSPYNNDWNGHYNNKTYGNGLYFYQLTIDLISTDGAFLSLGESDNFNIKVLNSACSQNCSLIDPSDPFFN